MRMRRTIPVCFPLLLGLILLNAPPAASAHPVPRQYYDRTVKVRLVHGRIVVDYRLDVDVLTVYDQLSAFSKEVDLPNLTRPEQFSAAFNRCYAELLADNLVARMDGKEVRFRCVKKGYATRDDNGQILDHLRCEFQFEAPWVTTGAERHEFTFRESNYELEPGRVRLSLMSEPPVSLVRKSAPDEALLARPDTELRPGDAERLRAASATFLVQAERPPAPAAPPAREPATSTNSTSALAITAAIAVFALAGILFLGRHLRRIVRS